MLGYIEGVAIAVSNTNESCTAATKGSNNLTTANTDPMGNNIPGVLNAGDGGGCGVIDFVVGGVVAATGAPAFAVGFTGRAVTAVAAGFYWENNGY